jgi:hypothetical protein
MKSTTKLRMVTHDNIKIGESLNHIKMISNKLSSEGKQSKKRYRKKEGNKYRSDA